jgi:hypothetical protein
MILNSKKVASVELDLFSLISNCDRGRYTVYNTSRDEVIHLTR